MREEKRAEQLLRFRINQGAASCTLLCRSNVVSIFVFSIESSRVQKRPSIYIVLVVSVYVFSSNQVIIAVLCMVSSRAVTVVVRI